jgi:hypothetical protein
MALPAEANPRQQFFQQLRQRPDIPREPTYGRDLLATYARGLLGLHDVAEYFSLNEKKPFEWAVTPPGVEEKVQIDVDEGVIKRMTRDVRSVKEELVMGGMSQYVYDIESGVQTLLEKEAAMPDHAADPFAQQVLESVTGNSDALGRTAKLAEFFGKLTAHETELSSKTPEVVGKLTSFARLTAHIIEQDSLFHGRKSNIVGIARKREFEMWEELRDLGFQDYANAIMEKIREIHGSPTASVQNK